jgi:hypothetical protein
MCKWYNRSTEHTNDPAYTSNTAQKTKLEKVKHASKPSYHRAASGRPLPTAQAAGPGTSEKTNNSAAWRQCLRGQDSCGMQLEQVLASLYGRLCRSPSQDAPLELLATARVARSCQASGPRCQRSSRAQIQPRAGLIAVTGLRSRGCSELKISEAEKQRDRGVIFFLA